jgi:hypothetical protein
MSSAKSLSQKCVREKLLLAGGAATLALSSGQSAGAAIVSAWATPIGPPPIAGSSTDWDLDGDSTADFSLSNSGSSAYFGEVNGGRVVQASRGVASGLAKLSAGFMVGSVMVTGHGFRPSADKFSVTFNSNIGTIGTGTQAWTMGASGYFGFKFTSGPNTYYGWAELTLDPANDGTKGYGYTITQAYYNDTPGAGIAVGDTGATVPEPSTCALALLAAGGVAAYKGRRKRAAV